MGSQGRHHCRGSPLDRSCTQEMHQEKSTQPRSPSMQCSHHHHHRTLQQHMVHTPSCPPKHSVHSHMPRMVSTHQRPSQLDQHDSPRKWYCVQTCVCQDHTVNTAWMHQGLGRHSLPHTSSNRHHRALRTFQAHKHRTLLMHPRPSQPGQQRKMRISCLHHQHTYQHCTERTRSRHPHPSRRSQQHSPCMMSHSSLSTDLRRTSHTPSMHRCPSPHDHSHRRCTLLYLVCCTHQPRMTHKLSMDQSQRPLCPQHTPCTMCSHSAIQSPQHKQRTEWWSCHPGQHVQARTRHS